jgi:hypothetical protein
MIPKKSIGVRSERLLRRRPTRMCAAWQTGNPTRYALLSRGAVGATSFAESDAMDLLG